MIKYFALYMSKMFLFILCYGCVGNVIPTCLIGQNGRPYDTIASSQILKKSSSYFAKRCKGLQTWSYVWKKRGFQDTFPQQSDATPPPPKRKKRANIIRAEAVPQPPTTTSTTLITTNIFTTARNRSSSNKCTTTFIVRTNYKSRKLWHWYFT